MPEEQKPQRPVASHNLHRLDYSKLSHEARWTLQNIADRLSLGFSRSELARFFGMPETWITKSMADLRRELREQLEEPAAEARDHVRS